MTTAKTKRWQLVDTPVERLLDAVGAPDLEYYSAAKERAVHEALGAWPLLAAVARAVREQRVREEPTSGPDQPLRVVVQASSDEEAG